MSVDVLLSRLDRVKPTGPGRWIVRCPVHEDTTPSLSIRELGDGRVLIHCFAGCDPASIVAAVGLDLADLFPQQPHDPLSPYRPERRPFLPADVFAIARREIAIAAILACDMHKRRAISEADYQRLLTAVSRLDGIAEAAYAR